MARKERRYHYIYKITCLKNDRYYIGMHSTDNLDDGYMGGGKIIKNSIKKHGKDLHRKEVLEFFENRELLRNRETELVNENLLKDPMCMNLQPGGGGGGGFSSEEHRKKFLSAGGKRVRQILSIRNAERIKNDPDYRERFCNSLKGNQAWLGKKHSEEAKQKIGKANSEKQTGNGNSQYGTCWITNGTENKKMKKTDDLPEGWSYGRR